MGDNTASQADSSTKPTVPVSNKAAPPNLDYLYRLELGVNAYFSTDLHRRRPRDTQAVHAPVIALGSSESSKRRVADFAHVWFDKYPYQYRSYFPNSGHVIEDLFDAYDIQVLGKSFLTQVLQFIMGENVAVAQRFTDDFVKKHPDVLETIANLEYDKKDPNAVVRKVFVNGEIETCHVVFLWHVANLIRLVTNRFREHPPPLPEIADAQKVAAKKAATEKSASRTGQSGGEANPKAEAFIIHPGESRPISSMPEMAPVIAHRMYICTYRLYDDTLTPSAGMSDMEAPPPHIMHPAHEMFPMGPFGPPHLGPHDMPNAPAMRQHVNNHPRNRSSSMRQSSGTGSANGTWRGGMRVGENDGVGAMIPPPSRHSSGAMSAVPSPCFNAPQPVPPGPAMGHRMHPSAMYGQFPGGPGSPQTPNSMPCLPQSMYPQQHAAPHGRPFPEPAHHGHGAAMMAQPYPPMGDMTNSRHGFNPNIQPVDIYPHGIRRSMRPDRSPTLYNPYGSDKPDFSNIPARRTSRNSMSNGQGRGRKQSFSSHRNNFGQSIGNHASYGPPDLGPLQAQPGFHNMETRLSPVVDPEFGCNESFIGPANDYVKELMVFDIPEGTTADDLLAFFRENAGVDANVHRIKADTKGKSLAHIRYINFSILCLCRLTNVTQAELGA